METIYDWVTVMLFAGLVTHLLASSVRTEADDIPLWKYLLLSGGCALANWLGNEGWDLFAIGVLLAGAAYAWRTFAPDGLQHPH
jgi:hypothetical protein